MFGNPCTRPRRFAKGDVRARSALRNFKIKLGCFSIRFALVETGINSRKSRVVQGVRADENNSPLCLGNYKSVHAVLIDFISPLHACKGQNLGRKAQILWGMGGGSKLFIILALLAQSWSHGSFANNFNRNKIRFLMVYPSSLHWKKTPQLCGGQEFHFTNHFQISKLGFISQRLEKIKNGKILCKGKLRGKNEPGVL